MKRNVIVTISREYGSGGREVAKLLADQLSIPFYDKQILSKMCQESGIDKEIVEKLNEDIGREVYYFDVNASRFMSGSRTMLSAISLHEKVYETQKKVINELANQSCVIVGRASGYILRNHPDVVRVFVTANIEDKKRRVIEEYGEEDVEIEKKLMSIDSMRANYYGYFSNQTWGKASNYDLVINTSKIGLENTAKVIQVYIDSRGEMDAKTD